MPKVFVPGFFQWGNKGDAALFQAFMTWVESAIGPSQFAFTSFDPNVDGQFFEADAMHMATRPRTCTWRAHRLSDRLPMLRPVVVAWNRLHVKSSLSFLRAWAPIYRWNPTMAKFLALPHIGRLADAIAAADVVIAVPGGYLLAPSADDTHWLLHLATLQLARDLGKPPVLGPSSIGPFHGRQRRWARRALSLATRIYVREDHSIEILRRLGGNPDLFVRTPDMAFAFVPGDLSGAGINATESLPSTVPLLGISMREHSFPGHSEPAQLEQQYVEEVARAAQRVVALGGHVVVVSQTHWDTRIGQRLVALLPKEAVTTIFDDDLTPSDLQAIYGHFRLMLGTRMHANILAMTAGTPVLGIAYEPKTAGILEEMGWPERIAWIDQVDSGLADRTEQLWASADEDRAKTLAGVANFRLQLNEAAVDLREHVSSRLST